jgi:hypothetical protein
MRITRLYKERLRGLLAQLVEQLTFNQLVEGSNPSQPTTFFRSDEEHTALSRDGAVW